jgi:hypothetical protein
MPQGEKLCLVIVGCRRHRIACGDIPRPRRRMTWANTMKRDGLCVRDGVECPKGGSCGILCTPQQPSTALNSDSTPIHIASTAERCGAPGSPLISPMVRIDTVLIPKYRKVRRHGNVEWVRKNTHKKRAEVDDLYPPIVYHDPCPLRCQTD